MSGPPASPPVPVGRSPFPSVRELVTGVREWFSRHLRRALLLSLAGFAIGWLLNTYVIAFVYDGFRRQKYSAGRATATAQGNLLRGGMYWTFLSMLVFGLIAYGWQAGWRRLGRDLVRLPRAIRGAFSRTGPTAWSLLLWGLAVSLLVSTFAIPAAAGVAALGLLVAAPSALAGIVGRFLISTWHGLLGLVAPRRQPRLPGLAAVLVPMVGGAAGMFVAFFDVPVALKFLFALGAVIGSYLFAVGGVRRLGGIPLVIVMTVALVAASHATAWADDGGWTEFRLGGGGLWDWLRWGPTHHIALLALGGGAASGLGALAGSGLGGFLADYQLPEDWWLEPDVSPPTGTSPVIDENGNVLEPNEQGLYQQYVDGEWRWVTREEAVELIRDAEYWKHVNELDRERARRESEEWSDRQWDQFVDDGRRRAEEDRARAAAERAERDWRVNTADRMATVALTNGYTDILDWLDAHDLPSADQLAQLRANIGRRMSDDAAIAAYYDKQSDLEFFARGVQDDAAWVARQAGNAIAGPAGGTIAEWLVRNPETPLRIALAVGTGGYSEVPFLYRDITTALDEAAARKSREQNLELTSGEIAWEVTKVGLWEIGGRIGGDLISDALSGGKPRGGSVEEMLDSARRGADETGDRLLQRVKSRLVQDEAGRWRRRPGAPDLTERPMLFDGSRKPPPADDFVRNYLREGDEVPLNHIHETGLTSKQVSNAGRICREEGVEMVGRTTNMDSMRHIRDKTGVPKGVEIKSKTIREADRYLNPDLKEGDEGLVGYFRPNQPDMNSVPSHLREEVAQRYTQRVEEYDHLRPDIDKLIADKRVVESGGRLIDVATGKPIAGDWDLVMFKDSASGEVIGAGARYDYLKNRWINEVGGQHGAEVNVVEDVVGSTRPGTPEYQHLIEKAEGLKAKLQASHTGGKEVVVKVGPDGILRRGPVGADVNLYPDADDIFREAAVPTVVPSPLPPVSAGPVRPPALPLVDRGTLSSGGGAAGGTLGSIGPPEGAPK